MRVFSLIYIMALVAVAGGCTSPSEHSVSGVWTTSFGDSKMLIRLDPDEHWSWWALQEAPPPKPPTQQGRWFIHDEILVLRVETSESCKLPPGLAFTFDVRKVTADRLTLYDLQMEKEEHWEKTANH